MNEWTEREREDGLLRTFIEGILPLTHVAKKIRYHITPNQPALDVDMRTHIGLQQ